MATNLLGKVALITGGAQGLGRAYAARLLTRGAKVSLVDLKQHVGQTTENELKQQHGSESTLFVPCDVTDKSQLEDAFQTTKKTLGGLDIVVNNAGIGDENNWERTIAVNLNALIYGSRLGLEAMRKDKNGCGGVIINVASIAGLTAAPIGIVYTASKFGAVGYTRSLAETYPVETVGVRVACLCPSFAKTEIMEELRAQSRNAKSTILKKSAEKLDLIIKMSGFEMEPSDVANAFMRLVDDKRAHGAVLAVSPAGQEYKYPQHLRGKLSE